MNKKAKVPTNVYFYLVIIFIFLIFITSIIFLGNELILNPNSNLNNESISYIADLQGINLSDYQIQKKQLENSILISDNESQGNSKDESLDFQFAKEKGLTIETTIKGIFSVPSLILYNVLKFDRNNWDWIVKILNWLWRLLIIIAIVYFARGIIS